MTIEKVFFTKVRLKIYHLSSFNGILLVYSYYQIWETPFPKPILYKLSDEEPSIANQSFLPAFQEVKFWYDYYFIANSSKNKLEVLRVC